MRGCGDRLIYQGLLHSPQRRAVPPSYRDQPAMTDEKGSVSHHPA
jgi:hypothetical protein